MTRVIIRLVVETLPYNEWVLMMSAMGHVLRPGGYCNRIKAKGKLKDTLGNIALRDWTENVHPAVQFQCFQSS